MPTKTSNGSGGGAWGTGSTWSGGVAPAIGTDDVIIAATDTVTYNLPDGGTPTPSLGIVINGLLSFSTAMSTQLIMGNANIAVGATGELRIGTSGGVLNKTYNAEIYWDTTADATYGLTVAAGGKVTLYGDPATYGSDFQADLADYCQVTGTLVPDVTGMYYPDAAYPSGWNDKTVYKRDGLVDGNQYYLWFDSGILYWRLTGGVGSASTYRWRDNTGNHSLNTYMTPNGGSSTGTALVINGWQPSASNKTFVVAGDFHTSLWQTGQELLIHRNGTMYQNTVLNFGTAGVGPLTIASLTANSVNSANTDVLVNETYTGSFLAGAAVLNLDRNIKLGKKLSVSPPLLGWSPNNRPIFKDANTVAGNTIISNAILTGFFQPGTNLAVGSNSPLATMAATFIKVVERHCELGVYSSAYGTIDAIVYSCTVPVGLHRINSTMAATYVTPNYGGNV